MSAFDSNMAGALGREEARQRLNAEHLLEVVMKRTRYSSQLLDDLTEIMVRAGRNLPHPDGRWILERLMHRTRYAPELVAEVDAVLGAVAKGKRFRSCASALARTTRPVKSNSFAQQVLKQLDRGPKTRAELLAVTGMTPSRLKDAIAGLKRKGQVETRQKAEGRRPAIYGLVQEAASDRPDA